MSELFQKSRRSWWAKFGGAFRGAGLGIWRQSSFFVHLISALVVVALAAVLRVSRVEWCLLLLCVFLVLTAEMFNSALETLAQAIDKHHNPYLADGLDIASAAVLTSSIGAAAAGLVIFLPRLLALL